MTKFSLILVVIGLALAILMLGVEVQELERSIATLQKQQYQDMETLDLMSHNIEGLLRMNQALSQRVRWLESQFNPIPPAPTPLPQSPGMQTSFH